MEVPQAKLKALFPHLRPERYEVTSDKSTEYNCVAWAAGKEDDKWWPYEGYYWPVEKRDESKESFVKAFESLGYEVCANGELEVGYQKVVIYAGIFSAKHMARQLPSGKWTSKMGEVWEDIQHDSVGDLAGVEYGKPAVFLKKRLAAI